MIDLWVDKYEPKTLDEFVWPSEQSRAQIMAQVKRGASDNLLFTGPPGVGKTSLSRLLTKQLSNPTDTLFIKASKDANIETVRNQFSTFVQQAGYEEGLKYIILDEADGIPYKAQQALRTEMEGTEVRWILTANDESGIHSAIIDRCMTIRFGFPSKDDYLMRIVNILEAENVRVETDEEVDFIRRLTDTFYPSLRAGIRYLQSNIDDNKIVIGHISLGWQADLLNSLIAGKVRTARDLVCANVPRNEIIQVYRFLYENIKLFNAKDEVILAIGEGIRCHSTVADQEINLAATFTRIAMEEKSDG